MNGMEPGTVVVVFDGSPAACEDLRRASSICAETGSALDVALSTSVSRWSLALGSVGGWDCGGLEDEMLEELHRDFAAAIAEIPSHVVVRSRVVDGREARRQRRSMAVAQL